MNWLKCYIKNLTSDHPIFWGILKAIQHKKYRQALYGLKALNPSRKIIISSNTLGISNRLKCLITSMHATDMTGNYLFLYWPKNWACRCYFSDLFLNEFFEIDDHILKTIQSDSKRIDKVFDSWRLQIKSDKVLENYKPTMSDNNKEQIDLEYENTPDEIIIRVQKQIKKLKPVDYIADEVKHFTEKFSVNTISVSIRSWPECIERAEAFFNIDEIYKKLDELADSLFFVSCDTEEVLNLLRVHS